MPIRSHRVYTQEDWQRGFHSAQRGVEIAARSIFGCRRDRIFEIDNYRIRACGRSPGEPLGPIGGDEKEERMVCNVGRHGYPMQVREFTSFSPAMVP
jgi:hypothetical protein